MAHARAKMLQALRGTFELERKGGGQRIYCFACQPHGFSLVKVRGRYKLRRRYPPRVLRSEPWDFSDSVALRMLLEQGETGRLAWQATHL
jgi:hypothetical protein